VRTEKDVNDCLEFMDKAMPVAGLSVDE
jgi:hypothetical protein